MKLPPTTTSNKKEEYPNKIISYYFNRHILNKEMKFDQLKMLPQTQIASKYDQPPPQSQSEKLSYLREIYSILQFHINESLKVTDSTFSTKQNSKRLNDIYNALSTLVFSTISLLSSENLEHFIRKTASQLPAGQFDINGKWGTVLTTVKNCRFQLSVAPQNETQKLQKIIQFMHYILVNTVSNLKADFQQLKDHLIEELMKINQELSVFVTFFTQLTKKYQENSQDALIAEVARLAEQNAQLVNALEAQKATNKQELMEVQSKYEKIIADLKKAQQTELKNSKLDEAHNRSSVQAASTVSSKSQHVTCDTPSVNEVEAQQIFHRSNRVTLEDISSVLSENVMATALTRLNNIYVVQNLKNLIPSEALLEESKEIKPSNNAESNIQTVGLSTEIQDKIHLLESTLLDTSSEHSALKSDILSLHQNMNIQDVLIHDLDSQCVEYESKLKELLACVLKSEDECVESIDVSQVITEEIVQKEVANRESQTDEIVPTVVAPAPVQTTTSPTTIVPSVPVVPSLTIMPPTVATADQSALINRLKSEVETAVTANTQLEARCKSTLSSFMEKVDLLEEKLKILKRERDSSPRAQSDSMITAVPATRSPRGPFLPANVTLTPSLASTFKPPPSHATPQSLVHYESQIVVLSAVMSAYSTVCMRKGVDMVTPQDMRVFKEATTGPTVPISKQIMTQDAVDVVAKHDFKPVVSVTATDEKKPENSAAPLTTSIKSALPPSAQSTQHTEAYKLSRIVKIQSCMRAVLAKRRVHSIRTSIAAYQQGVLTAYPGTNQGETGWYIAGEQLFYFILDKDEFVLLCGPISREIYEIAKEEIAMSSRGKEFGSRRNSTTLKFQLDRLGLHATRIQIETLLDDLRTREKLLNQLNYDYEATTRDTQDECNRRLRYYIQECETLKRRNMDYQEIILGLERKCYSLRANEQDTTSRMNTLFTDVSTDMDKMRQFVRLTSIVRGFLGRLRHKRIALFKMANQTGVLVAMKNTTQGESGWYAGPNGTIFYFVLKNGEWIHTAGPISEKDFQFVRTGMKQKFKSAALGLLTRCPFRLAEVHDDVFDQGELYVSNENEKLFLALSVDRLMPTISGPMELSTSALSSISKPGDLNDSLDNGSLADSLS